MTEESQTGFDPPTPPGQPVAGGIVAELAQMSERQRAEYLAEVAEVVAPDRRIGVEIGQTLLEVRDVTLRFGGLVALDSVSFQIKRGEILGLIGPNGAGKTTCFNVMTGVYRPTSGQVLLEGASLGGHKRYQITQLGLARTFQNIRLFGEMTACSSSASRTGPRKRPATCPTATSGASRSPGPWPPSRNCCALTSRPPASTPPRRKISWG